MIRSSPALASGLDARFSVRFSRTLLGNVNIDPRAQTPLDARFGWGSRETLTWLAQVQKQIWVTRHGDPVLRCTKI